MFLRKFVILVFSPSITSYAYIIAYILPAVKRLVNGIQQLHILAGAINDKFGTVLCGFLYYTRKLEEIFCGIVVFAIDKYIES